MNLTDDYHPAAGAPRPDPADDDRLVAAVREYQAALDAGRPPDRTAFLARHPAIAGELADCLGGMLLLHNLLPRPADAVRPGLPLGDYRLVREVGRGGMGVVYEAEQLSLGRRVALKVLPFAATLDARQLQRFRTEATAAANLHHPHIVQVYGVGCDRGVHYYAMQFIDGQTLADVIRRLRQDLPARPSRRPPPARPARRRTRASTSARSPAGAPRRPRRWSTPTGSASSTATSSRPTCCSTPAAPCSSPTSAWPTSPATTA